MKDNSVTKAAILMVFIVITAVAGYEMYLRSLGANVAYDDGAALWSGSRAKVYRQANEQVVFIGSSRIKYDLDIPTWNENTGLEAVQLACVGSSPRPMLEDLANDANFKGRLIIDVTEPLFFSDAPFFVKTPNENIKYFHDRTYAQKASFHLNNLLESNLVFLDKDNYSMNAQLDALGLPNRPGVFQMPIFPRDFGRTTADRQTYMTDPFVADANQVNAVRGIWKFLMDGPKGPPMTDPQIAVIIQSVKKCTDKIKARGGEVIFVRTPSSGPFLMGEIKGFPRERYWDKLLTVTDCEGIHFQDYPSTANFQCPEFSHLSLSDAKLYTVQFVKILSGEKRWAMNTSKNKQTNSF